MICSLRDSLEIPRCGIREAGLDYVEPWLILLLTGWNSVLFEIGGAFSLKPLFLEMLLCPKELHLLIVLCKIALCSFAN